LFAAGPDWLLSTYEPEGSFPLYQDVTPQTHARFLIERAPLIELLSEVAIATSDDSKMVRVDLDPQQMRLSAAAPGIGDSSATLPCQFLGGGDAVIHTAFNPAYLLDALKSLGCASVVVDVDQNGYGCDHKVYGKPAILYAEHDPATRWIVMPVNAELPATHENLGSNYPKGLEDGPDSATQSAP
jgi:DNA polymerase III sliding clamp (beta) subunit (PCNA family)